MTPDSERPGDPGPASASASTGRISMGRISPTRVLVATAIAVTMVWLAVVALWHDAPFALTFDDAFYYFGIARNVAHGCGSTFDGIDPTNGYHPLWMLMAVPVYSLGLDSTTAVRVLLAGQILILGAALATLAVVAGRAIDNWQRLSSARPDDGRRAATWCTATVALTLAVAGGNPFIVKVFANGLESGVLVLLDALILAIGAAWRSRWLTRGSGRARIAVGMLLALTILARTDSLLLVAGLGLWTLAEARALGRRAVRPMLELFVLPAVTTAAYLISNQVQFGIWLQISGIVKRQDITPARAAIMLVMVVVALAIGRQGFRRLRAPRGGLRFRRVGRFAASTAWFAGFAIVLVAYYQVLQSQQWLWYYCPVVLYALFLLVLGVADFVESAVVEAPPSGSLVRALAPIEAILLVPLVVAFVLQARTFADPHLRSILVANRDAGVWIDQNLPPDAVLGSWDAGVVGYYANRPVINLDGVANSHEYYDAGRNGTVGAFLEARGLTNIVNHGLPVDGQDPDTRSFIRSTFGERVEKGSLVVQLFPFVYSGTTTSNSGATSGTRPLAVFVYEVPATAAPPT